MLNPALAAVALLPLLTTGRGQDVRLVGGPSPPKGRLEVYHNDTWRTMSAYLFHNAAARVICHMLGYGYVGQFASKRFGGYGTTCWYLNDLRCSGTEANIGNCRHGGWRRSSYCNNYAFVSCFTEVKLVGDSGSKGRLEVYHNGTWGTVCDNGFSDAAARVVCSMLGYERSGRFIANRYDGMHVDNSYGAGSGPIWLDNVRCDGRESHIIECQHDGWGYHDCSHDDDVSISCIADSAEAVALVGGGNPRVGRLEVFHGNQWGTVCDDGFTDVAARVVCYSLGFGYVGRKVDINLYGEGDGLIWLNNISCSGTERYIGECQHSDWGVYNGYCTHREDVAISCTHKPVTPVRLFGGSNSTGRLEVLHNEVWGTVCSDFFTATEASVVCRMLGFGSGTKIHNSNYTIKHGPIWLDNVQCNGTDSDIAECSHNGWGVHNCQHREDVAVSCARTEVEVRLNGGRDPGEGRLEVFYSGSWGTVCTGEFNDAAAKVVCNMLGFGYVGRPSKKAEEWHGYSHGPIWLNSFRCTGTEGNIADCQQNGWGVSSCPRSEEQAVSCLDDDAVALFGGGSPREGRLEVYQYYNGLWGSVCDERFTVAEARVVCHSLGFGYIGRVTNIFPYSIGTGIISFTDVHCNGNESHISECSNSRWGSRNCEQYEYVAVSCVGDSSPTSTPSTSSIVTTSSAIATSSIVSVQSGSNHHTFDGTLMVLIITAVVGGGLLLISVIVIIAYNIFRRNGHINRHGSAEGAEIPMHVIAAADTDNADEFDDDTTYDYPVSNTQASDIDAYYHLQDQPAPVAGAVGGVDSEDSDYQEPSPMYQWLPNEQEDSSQV